MLSSCLSVNYNLHLIVDFSYLASFEKIFPFPLLSLFLFTVGFKQAQVKIKAVAYIKKMHMALVGTVEK